MSKILVFGFATGSKDIEMWSFDDAALSKKFCEKLARDTGINVYQVEGTLIGRYFVEQPPVKFEANENYKNQQP